MLELIKKVPLFAQLEEQQLNALVEICTRRSYKAARFYFKKKNSVPYSIWFLAVPLRSSQQVLQVRKKYCRSAKAAKASASFLS